MTLENIIPSIFTNHPFESVMHKMEPEIIARNIMVIRARCGDNWPLSFDQYRTEREKDGGHGCANYEKQSFDEIIAMIPDALGAISFSKTWAKAARTAITP